MRSSSAFRVSLGGVAVVCCVHEREKRLVTSERQIAELGLQMRPPVRYDPAQHKIHLCACCQNLFVSNGDEPRFCRPCQVPPAYALGGPLPEPRGVVE